MIKTNTLLASSLIAMSSVAGAAPADAAPGPAGSPSPLSSHALAGTWTLVAADVIRPDGSRARDYGAAPSGLLIIDAHGHYSLQIFKAERPRFASGDKARGTPSEYQAAVQGSSTHLGTLSIDAAAGTLTFHIQNASFPNWEGVDQIRRYELHGDELSYSVPPRPDGGTPISVWKRAL